KALRSNAPRFLISIFYSTTHGIFFKTPVPRVFFFFASFRFSLSREQRKTNEEIKIVSRTVLPDLTSQEMSLSATLLLIGHWSLVLGDTSFVV
ncbi:hypothetical protein, partial [Nitratifractor sp.]